ncbi:18051_t:CDS:10 [Dentiscutata erythropus]|uniref:Vesicular-fusion protein SEC18 n=1 Tax=Dentiscutata erythropus TaxID=1348616 RepID=A0A9N9E9P2_9GLOM|nr:18051_t:CDS:10 [Dentiscutata erythropus]
MDPYSSRQPTKQLPPSVPAAPQTFRVKVGRSPSEALALKNFLVVSPRDFHPSVRYVIVEDQAEENQPPRQIGTSMVHRRWASLSLGQEVSIAPYDPSFESPNIYLGRLDLEVSFLRKTTEIKEHFDTEEMSKICFEAFNNQIFSVNQQIVFDFHGINLQIVVKGLSVVDIADLQRGLVGDENANYQGSRTATRGILMQQTTIHWLKASDSSIRLKGPSAKVTTAIIQPNFKFEDMGIGGLDSEFSAIFRRAFASRIFPPSLVEKIGIQHVKGILLFGPPGTGKTLMARQIGKMLNAREPKIVSGPEILNKYVGQSEENIRKLFAEAEKEYKEKGDESGLHIIIFDEIDAICKQRGGRSDSTGVGDSIVNQLLSKMDGVEQLNNILIIGMTNRHDLIDEALLRPGRLEVHMEIGLPDERGRLQILKIHTAKMKQNDIMDPDVDLDELASLTKNFSGAEINGLVKSASSFAFNRHVKVGTLAGVATDMNDMKINKEDFLCALDEVHPAFGVNEEELQQCVQNQIIPFASNVERILSDGQLFIEQVRKSSRTPLVSVLLHGPPGSGKTALAATMAMSSEFPFIKLISPETMVGYAELAKIAIISKVFNDSYKSPLSVIVIDNIERILDWVPIGPRFSNSILQTLLVLLKKRPPKDRRLLILATTNEKSVLDDMNMSDCFNSEIYVPNITELSSVDVVLKELALFSDEERNQALNALKQGGVELRIGIKKLLTIIEMSRQDVDKVDKFISTILSMAPYKVEPNTLYMPDKSEIPDPTSLYKLYE